MNRLSFLLIWPLLIVFFFALGCSDCYYSRDYETGGNDDVTDDDVDDDADDTVDDDAADDDIADDDTDDDDVVDDDAVDDDADDDATDDDTAETHTFLVILNDDQLKIYTDPETSSQTSLAAENGAKNALATTNYLSANCIARGRTGNIGEPVEVLGTAENSRPYAVAVGPDQTLHVAYIEAVTYRLMHAVREEDGWRQTMVKQLEGFIYYYGSLAMGIDSDGIVHLAHSGNEGHSSGKYGYPLLYATNESGIWVTVELESDVCDCDLQVDADDRVHIIWNSGYEVFPQYLTLLTRDGQTWSEETVAVSLGLLSRPYLDLDAQQRMAVYCDSYLELQYIYPITYYFANLYRKKNWWVRKVLYQLLEVSSWLESWGIGDLDDMGAAHVFYTDEDERTVYKTDESGVFVSEIIEHIELYNASILAYDDGKVLVPFLTSQYYNVRLLMREDGVWTETAIGN